ncbi:MAG TPA: oligosaccharide flippase family protein [Aromatoleum sp.]|uniref:lipopolysaccharide biosynthesis protein n=1 Tax=Aromatoleum sp. TaxID=2307007 RepID=UPI002B47AACD|nr:oligosaccharide flippase family protein [Aromatoleum sp.]HJV25442.1 oligosaccharide flippase family protein [Aromatoleum sp.]
MRQALIVAYAAQAYIALIGFLLLPVYMDHLGPEAFGLVGFSMALQAWLQLLDLGMSSALSRELSLFRAGQYDAVLARAKIRALEWIFGTLSVMAAGALLIGRGAIASTWFSIERLTVDEVSSCVALMAVTAALRLFGGLYRAALTGMERQLRLNAVLSLFATAKALGVIPVLAYVSSSPQMFFAYQALVGALELVALGRAFYRVMPPAPASPLPHLAACRSMLPTAGAVAAVSFLSLVITQLDKVLLPRFIPLSDFGRFTLVTAMAGGILIIAGPMGQILQPRMTILSAGQRDAELRRLYSTASRLASALFFSVGGGLAVFAEPIMWVWTGDRILAEGIAPTLTFYSLANAIVGVLTMPYLLQFAHGNLGLHVAGSLIMTIFVVPAMYLAAASHGALGTAIVAFSANALYLVLWIPLVHHRLLPEMVFRWPLAQVAPPAAVAMAVLLIASVLGPVGAGRLVSAAWCGAAMLAAFLAAVSIAARSEPSPGWWVLRRD